ncbi:MAG: NUDIX hydrolase [Candidatus Aenigmarchaeota archaeon]|nr:NUDIX hydrolase [Candidatus Aenigmarchaeota archaeon]
MKIKNWTEPEKSPKIAVDVLVVRKNKIVLLRRDIEPFRGSLDFPGGMVEYGETVENAAVREVKEETGLDISLKNILGVYSSPSRDPRFHAITIAFVSGVKGGSLKSSFEGRAEWHDVDKIPMKEMGFDHAKILRDYIKWKRKKGTYWSTK